MNLIEKNIKKYDKNDMFSLLKNFPKHCYEGYNVETPLVAKKFKKIIFTGMGGSGISGDIMKILLEEKNIPVFVVKDYVLPSFTDEESLVIAESYSGNTEETLNTYKIAKERKSLILCVSSNGELEKLCQKDNIPIIKIPLGLPPRCAFGYLFFTVYKFFVNLNILSKLDNGFFKKIENWTNEFLPSNENNRGIEIAGKFFKKIPLIYSENRFLPGILRWKTQIAENSKNFCFINVLPEMNHNEIMSFYFPKYFLKKLIVLFVISGLENERIKKRIDITKDLISNKINEVLMIELKGDTILEKLLYLIIFGDWVSFYLAILNKINPTEIREIDILKEKLKGG
ncbi:MAG: bifunctional phosphoglucose/phosphomannose isomerase [Candidatus Omnitrophica bacterium]|nr:bifunctional phosphoglucose/phosphomannose isomerase [Candidatus Omnitrophota bacterium]MCM8807043.1 bifunctional phosphoglucose/phosphomannose isomerase [Candidatus Omnitrophota bacterium]